MNIFKMGTILQDSYSTNPMKHRNKFGVGGIPKWVWEAKVIRPNRRWANPQILFSSIILLKQAGGELAVSRCCDTVILAGCVRSGFYRWSSDSANTSEQLRLSQQKPHFRVTHSSAVLCQCNRGIILLLMEKE